MTTPLRWLRMKILHHRLALSEMEAENERLRRELGDLLAGRLDIRELVVRGGAFDMRLGNDGAVAYCETVYQLYKTSGAANHLCIAVTNREGERFEVTIQRVAGETPAQQNVKLRAEIAALRADCARISKECGLPPMMAPADGWLRKALEDAFRGGYHCAWMIELGRYSFDPALKPGDPDGAWRAYCAARQLD
jgi:hypothetical protein